MPCALQASALDISPGRWGPEGCSSFSPTRLLCPLPLHTVPPNFAHLLSFNRTANMLRVLRLIVAVAFVTKGEQQLICLRENVGLTVVLHLGNAAVVDKRDAIPSSSFAESSALASSSFVESSAFASSSLVQSSAVASSQRIQC